MSPFEGGPPQLSGTSTLNTSNTTTDSSDCLTDTGVTDDQWQHIDATYSFFNELSSADEDFRTFFTSFDSDSPTTFDPYAVAGPLDGQALLQAQSGQDLPLAVPAADEGFQYLQMSDESTLFGLDQTFVSSQQLANLVPQSALNLTIADEYQESLFDLVSDPNLYIQPQDLLHYPLPIGNDITPSARYEISEYHPDGPFKAPQTTFNDYQSEYPPPSIAEELVQPYGNLQTQQSWLARPIVSNTNTGQYASRLDAGSQLSPSIFLDPVPELNPWEPTVSGQPIKGQVIKNDSVASFPPLSFEVPVLQPTNLKASVSKPTFSWADLEEIKTPKISSSRLLKKRQDPASDPSCFYGPGPWKKDSWGSISVDGRPLFTYTAQGQLAHDRVYSTAQLQEYVGSRRATCWVQNAPAQCNNRMDADDRKCRWADCPISAKLIAAGWLRVAFDEFPDETSNGTKDPFKVAGVMHLWCFEQCFDLVDIHANKMLRPETRHFPKESKNPMSLERDRDRDIIVEAYNPWFRERIPHWTAHGAIDMPRDHKDSLSFQLIEQHLRNQTPTRQRARLKRNDKKPTDSWKTIDVHKGDLGLYTQIHRKTRREHSYEEYRSWSEASRYNGNDSESFLPASSCKRKFSASDEAVEEQSAKRHQADATFSVNGHNVSEVLGDKSTSDILKLQDNVSLPAEESAAVVLGLTSPSSFRQGLRRSPRNSRGNHAK